MHRYLEWKWKDYEMYLAYYWSYFLYQNKEKERFWEFWRLRNAKDHHWKPSKPRKNRCFIIKKVSTVFFKSLWYLIDFEDIWLVFVVFLGILNYIYSGNYVYWLLNTHISGFVVSIEVLELSSWYLNGLIKKVDYNHRLTIS